jgi:hypothetical protein
VYLKLKDWRGKNVEARRLINQKQELKNIEKRRLSHRISAKKNRDNNPVIHSARNMIYKTIKRGKVVRGICVVCGSVENIQAHHEDYSKPLDVIWLCRFHHQEIHNQKRKMVG